MICRRLDHDGDGNYTESGTLTYYHLSDDQFSTVAVLDTNAALVERIDYDAYGQARHHFLGDTDGDGDQQTDDRTKITTLYGVGIGGSTYNVDCDIDRSGTINSTDHGLASTTYSAFAKGILSNVGNIYGFSNYVLNSEVNAGLVYTVRFRHYDTSLGRWLERDPLQYVDGMSMYGYCMGMPLAGMDPMGLGFWDGDWAIHEWIAENFWMRVHSTETLATMSTTRATVEAVGLSVLLGVGIFYGGQALLPMLGRAGALLGRGGYGAGGWLNRWPLLRFGWGWKGTAKLGQLALRFASGGRWGSVVLPWHWHFYVWPLSAIDWWQVGGLGLAGLAIYELNQHARNSPAPPAPASSPDPTPPHEITCRRFGNRNLIE